MTPSLTKLLVGAVALLTLAPAMHAQNPARPKPQRPIEVPPAVVVLQIDTTEGDSTRTIIQRDFDYGDRLQPLILDSLTMADVWKPGDRLVPGVWNIPIPADGAEASPDVVIAPVVGFDSACYRLGYGGGFFDRTLASLPHRPLAIGVGYDATSVSTIYPLPHDVPMEAIVTEREILRPTSECKREK